MLFMIGLVLRNLPFEPNISKFEPVFPCGFTLIVYVEFLSLYPCEFETEHKLQNPFLPLIVSNKHVTKNLYAFHAKVNTRWEQSESPQRVRRHLSGVSKYFWFPS